MLFLFSGQLESSFHPGYQQFQGSFLHSRTARHLLRALSFISELCFSHNAWANGSGVKDSLGQENGWTHPLLYTLHSSALSMISLFEIFLCGTFASSSSSAPFKNLRVYFYLHLFTILQVLLALNKYLIVRQPWGRSH